MAAVYSDDSPKGHHSQARTQKNDGPGIGELLRGAREHLGLTLEQVAGETKIPRRHLEGLDHGTFAALPAFYQRAEIRTYARAVNLDPDLVLARFERGLAPSVVPEISPKPPTLHTPAFSRNRALIASAFVLTAIVFWRAMPRDLSLGVQTAGEAADSTRPMAVPGKPAMHAAVGSDRRELDRNPQPPAPAEPVLRGGIEHTDARPAVAEKGDIPITTQPGDERPSAELVTELIVTTEPAGARVTVDGIGWGVTPATIRYLAPGDKRIRVSKEGYASTERVVSVAEGRRQTAGIRLRNNSQTE